MDGRNEMERASYTWRTVTLKSAPPGIPALIAYPFPHFPLSRILIFPEHPVRA